MTGRGHEAQVSAAQKSKATVVACCLVVSGCATVDPSLDYEQAQRMTGDAIGVDSASVAVPSEAERSSDRIESLLADGISREEAVEVALLNNQDLQVRLLEIGVSRADVAQAGALSNPSLGAVVRFPNDGSDATLEARLALNLIDLWHRPARKRVQERRLERTVLQTAHDAAELVAKTKLAYVSAVAAQRGREVEEENLASTQEFLDLTLAREEAGASTIVETNAARAEMLEQEVRLRSSRLAELEAKSRLATILGLDVDPLDLVLVSPLALHADSVPSLDILKENARSHRLDLWAAKENVRAAVAAVSLQRRMFLPELNGSVELESRGGDTEIGPGVELELPLFDQNRAQVTKAEYRQRQAEAVLAALTVSAQQQVRTAYERLVTTLETARSYEEEIEPLRESGLELARESFGAGKSGFLVVMEAQKRLLAARRDAISWAEASAVMVVELEAVCGRPMREIHGAPEGGRPPE